MLILKIIPPGSANGGTRPRYVAAAAGHRRHDRPGDAAPHLPRQLVPQEPRGRFAWPGYGENSRVLKWIAQRLSGQAGAVATPIGNLPAKDALDTEGLAVSEHDLQVLLSVDPGAWHEEAALIREHLATFGRHLPGQLWEEHDRLLKRLKAAS